MNLGAWIENPTHQQAGAVGITCENLVTAAISASGSYRNNVPENTVDNNLNTRWSNSALGSWIKYDLGQEKMICYVDIAWFKGNQRTYNFVISTSLDGNTFTDLFTGISVKTTALQSYDIADTKARFVKITINGNSANSWAEITELDIYGYLPDVVAPTVQIIRPAEGSSLYVGRITVEGTSSDNSGGSGVKSVEVWLDNGASTQASPNAPNDWSSWTATIDIPSEGNHVIHAKATDAANNGNENTVAVMVVIDSGLPTVQITSPAEGSEVTIVDGILSINGTAVDTESGIKLVELQLDNSGIYQNASPLSEGDWSFWTGMLTINTNGTHTITARATDNAGNVVYSSVEFNATIQNVGLDKFGIKKIYPTAAGGNEWYVNMNDPRNDPYFRNLQNLQLTLQPDGSWQVYAQNGQVRMESWSQENGKWLNVEITEYAKIEKTTNSLLQMYTRGGHHTSSDPCLGSAYKARIYGDGRAGWVKEVTHPAYTSTTGWVQATDKRLEDRWVGFKAVIYNFVENGNTYVRMESYIDDDVTDANGNLVIKNNWRLASVVEDRGEWATTNSDFTSTCLPMSVDSTDQYRQRDEILSLPGGTGTQNIAAWRTDGTTWDFKYFSVREIQAPQ